MVSSNQGPLLGFQAVLQSHPDKGGTAEAFHEAEDLGAMLFSSLKEATHGFELVCPYTPQLLLILQRASS